MLLTEKIHFIHSKFVQTFVIRIFFRNNYPQLKKNSHMPPSPHLLQCVNSQTIGYKCRSFCKVSAMFVKIKTLQI